MSTHEAIPFDVDAALLRELGERLVGRADIALAELVKNAYDADASLVHVQISRLEQRSPMQRRQKAARKMR
jgi:hypothetical protein